MQPNPIARFRRLKGWTQTDLAQQLGVSLNTIQRWEGGAQPRPRHFAKLVEALGVSALELDTALREWGQAQGEQKAAA